MIMMSKSILQKWVSVRLGKDGCVSVTGYWTSEPRYFSHLVGKPEKLNVVSERVRHKPICAVTEKELES